MLEIEDLRNKELVQKTIREDLLSFLGKLHRNSGLSEVMVSDVTGINRIALRHFLKLENDPRLSTCYIITVYYLRCRGYQFHLDKLLSLVLQTLNNLDGCIVYHSISPNELKEHPEYVVLMEHKGESHIK